jgi:hypothetical protein
VKVPPFTGPLQAAGHVGERSSKPRIMLPQVAGGQAPRGLRSRLRDGGWALLSCLGNGSVSRFRGAPASGPA